MTEFITRNYGNKNFEIIIKTDSKEHYKATQDFARRLIDHAKPTIEAKPIVHAHWIPREVDSRGWTNKFECSECHCVTEHFCYIRKYEYEADFCSCCGAQMDEVVVEENATTMNNEVFTAENPVVAEEVITDPPVATEEEKEKYLNKEIDYIKSYRIEEEHKYD